MSIELEFLSKRVTEGKLSRRDFLCRSAALGVTMIAANGVLETAAAAAGPRKGGTLRAAMSGGSTTDSLDPAMWQSQVPAEFGSQWAEGLLSIDPQGQIVRRVAEDFGSSADGRKWTFKIRKGVTFHNGKTVTAEDVAASVARHADKNSKSAAYGLLTEISDIRAVGYDVVVTLKQPNADLPYLMADYHLAIQPGGGKDNPESGIGCGPYKVASNEPGVRMTGERFRDYWDPELGHAETIEILVVNDDNARLLALQGGQVDMINRVDPKLAKSLAGTEGLQLRNVSGRGHNVFVLRCDDPQFSNVDLRMALKLAVDRADMVKRVLSGFGTVGNDTPINSAYPLFSDDIEQRTYDPDKAAFHFKKSGNTNPVILRTSEVAFPGAVDAALLFQQSAAKAGIQIEVKKEPGDGYWSDVWNKMPFVASNWGGRSTQDQMFSTAYLSNAAWNETHFSNETFDRLLSAARAELDQEKRKAIYRDMSTIVRDEGGLICPMFADFVDATGPRVEGWVDDPNFELSGGRALSRCWVRD